MQLDLIDRRTTAAVTQAMHDDVGLRGAIRWMRRDYGGDFRWPYCEKVADIEGRAAWAVDDGHIGYIVIGSIVFGLNGLEIAAETIRTGAQAAFRRLDASC